MVTMIVFEASEPPQGHAGDFNAAPDSASVRFWRGLQSLGDTSVCYRDAWESAHSLDPGHTFTPRNPLVVTADNWPLELGRRLDYTMVCCVDHGPTLDIPPASASSTSR